MTARTTVGAISSSNLVHGSYWNNGRQSFFRWMENNSKKTVRMSTTMKHKQLDIYQRQFIQRRRNQYSCAVWIQGVAMGTMVLALLLSLWVHLHIGNYVDSGLQVQMTPSTTTTTATSPADDNRRDHLPSINALSRNAAIDPQNFRIVHTLRMVQRNNHDSSTNDMEATRPAQDDNNGGSVQTARLEELEDEEDETVLLYYKDSPVFAADQYTKDRRQTLTGGGAFVHMGKTGGSSLSVLLRNGCHSWLPHPCRSNIPNESMASQRIVSYYHVGDFGLLPHSSHDFYILTMRDPFDRTLSALAYEHYTNVQARNETDSISRRIRRRYQQACQQCFPTIEQFVQLLGSNNGNTNSSKNNNDMEGEGEETEEDPSIHFSYPYPKYDLVVQPCQDLVRAIFHGRVRHFNHLFFNYQRIASLIPNIENHTLYVTRLEHLWHDWEIINQQLQQQQQPPPQSRPPQELPHQHPPPPQQQPPPQSQSFSTSNQDDATISSQNDDNDENTNVNNQQLSPRRHLLSQSYDSAPMREKLSSSSLSSSSLLNNENPSVHGLEQPPFKKLHIRNTAPLNLPVTRYVSDHGRTIYCRALQQEYNAYFWLLGHAQNLEKINVVETLVQARQNCPQLKVDLKFLSSQQKQKGTTNQMIQQ